MPKKMWKETMLKEIAAYNKLQLNTYLGFNHNAFGYILKIDLHFYTSKSKRWSYVWNTYFGLFYHEFNQDLFDYAINKAKEYFYHIDNDTPYGEIPCCEFIFECSNACKDFCPNPIEKVKMDTDDTCAHCGDRIEMETTGITRNGKMYHYTNEKGHAYEKCVEAAKRDWEVTGNE
jgi:hypothetical protein